MNGQALARNTDPVTSHEAAESVRGAVSARLQRLLLVLLDLYPDGLTCSEAAAMLRMPRDSLSPRFPSLRHLKLVHDSGGRRAGPTGRRQIVWRLGPPLPLKVLPPIAIDPLS